MLSESRTIYYYMASSCICTTMCVVAWIEHVKLQYEHVTRNLLRYKCVVKCVWVECLVMLNQLVHQSRRTYHRDAFDWMLATVFSTKLNYWRYWRISWFKLSIQFIIIVCFNLFWVCDRETSPMHHHIISISIVLMCDSRY